MEHVETEIPSTGTMTDHVGKDFPIFPTSIERGRARRCCCTRAEM